MANDIQSIAKAAISGLDLHLFKYMTTNFVPKLKGQENFSKSKFLLLKDIELQGFGKYTKEDGTGIGEYARKSVKTKEYAIEVDIDISFQFNIDIIDKNNSANILNAKNILQRHNKKFLSPGYDRVYFSKLVWKNEAGDDATGATIKNGAYNTIDTADEFLKEFDIANTALDNANVPAEGRILYCYPAIEKIARAIKRKYLTVSSNDQKVNSGLSSLDEVSIISTPKSRLKDKVSYSTAEAAVGAKQIHFVLVHNSSTFRAVRRDNLKIIMNSVNQTSDSDMLARRIVFTSGILPNREKAAYIYKDA